MGTRELIEFQGTCARDELATRQTSNNYNTTSQGAPVPRSTISSMIYSNPYNAWSRACSTPRLMHGGCSCVKRKWHWRPTHVSALCSQPMGEDPSSVSSGTTVPMHCTSGTVYSSSPSSRSPRTAMGLISPSSSIVKSPPSSLVVGVQKVGVAGPNDAGLQGSPITIDVDDCGCVEIFPSTSQSAGILILKAIELFSAP